jgi:apolipoprotein N-acyltransferase
LKRFFLLRWLPPLSLVLSAVASGALLALAFPPASLGPVGFVALVPVVVALYKKPHPRKHFFKTGYLFASAFFLGHLWWIVKLVPSSSITMPWLMTPALILLVAYLSVYPALVFWLLSILGRGSGIASVLIAPALWMIGELARSSTELGFSWGVIGYALARYPVLIQTANVVGLFGLGAMVVLVNMIWSRVFLVKSSRARAVYFVAGAALVGLVTVHGARTITKFSNQTPAQQTAVAIAQPNVDLRLKWDPAFTDSTFRLIERFSREAAGYGAKMIVFPETSAPVYLKFQPNYLNKISRLTRELDMAIYIGFLDGRYDGPNDSLNIYNSAALFDTDGAFVQYDKTHLLPFGEAIPFAWKFPSFKNLDFGQANFHPGPYREPAPSSAGALGAMICFESIFPDIARELVANGAEVLVNITNDGWFGMTPGPYQHNDMAILRAVENRRYLVRSSNTGISMVVDPVGRIVASLGLYREGVVVDSISARRDKTIYTRFGDRPVVLAAVILIILGFVIARRQ